MDSNISAGGEAQVLPIEVHFAYKKEGTVDEWEDANVQAISVPPPLPAAMQEEPDADADAGADDAAVPTASCPA